MICVNLSFVISNKKDVYMMYFDDYMAGINELSQIVQSLETICAEMSQVPNIIILEHMYKNDCEKLFRDAGYAIGKVRKNDFTKYHWHYYYGDDKYKIKQLEKTCREYNREFRKIKRKYKKCEKLCAKIYGDVLRKLSHGNKFQDVIADDKRLKLIVEKLKAEATIKEAETKEHEATIATEKAKKAEADAKKAAEDAKIAQAVAQKKQAEAKIKEADAVIAAAEKAKADLAIEKHKTEQLRLQAEERKAREEEAILSVEERCRIMYDEFLKTLQGGIVNPAKTK